MFIKSIGSYKSSKANTVVAQVKRKDKKYDSQMTEWETEKHKYSKRETDTHREKRIEKSPWNIVMSK